MTPRRITLHEAAERLGVHYMTAYRYVRTGRLAATKRGDTWEVDVAALATMRRRRTAEPGRRGSPGHAARVPELVRRLIATDEPGAWAVAESALAAGAEPEAVYLDVFVPALQQIGDAWARNEIDVAAEHGASSVMLRLVGRLGPRFRHRGRPRGVVVIGAPENEHHNLPIALAADVLRGHGYAVVDLGADVPTASFVSRVTHTPGVLAVCVTATTVARRADVRRLISALRDASEVPVLVGGAGVTASDARRAGAAACGTSARELVDMLDTVVWRAAPA